MCLTDLAAQTSCHTTNHQRSITKSNHAAVAIAVLISVIFKLLLTTTCDPAAVARNPIARRDSSRKDEAGLDEVTDYDVQAAAGANDVPELAGEVGGREEEAQGDGDVGGDKHFAVHLGEDDG
ncbi:hypothetical protein QC762_0009420 [Podospora pseudocomata]|uniref:Uncharacterized protein n=1 Tax=Podospora pseudocomata TaxID=2093779 RepID=A0ABR0GUR1_9PEZI|nr:hypothetical protein QC762_0009420 [Podospora pseudocomata]